jgi:hypothetical protein
MRLFPHGGLSFEGGRPSRTGGSTVIDKVPLLRRHAGIGPDLILLGTI